MIIAAIPTIFIGLGINAKFANSGVPVHPLLENNIIVALLFIIGIAGYIWSLKRTFYIHKKIKEIENNLNT